VPGVCRADLTLILPDCTLQGKLLPEIPGMSRPSQTRLLRARIVSVVFGTLVSGFLTWGQQTQPDLATTILKSQGQALMIKVYVLDAGGLPFDRPAQVRLYSVVTPMNLNLVTQEEGVADFANVMPGEYELEVTSPGFRKAKQHLHVINLGENFSAFVYVHSETEPQTDGPSKADAPVRPKLQQEINKGLELLQKKQYEKADARFAKASLSAPENPNLWYLRGTAELGRNRKDLAQKSFEQALSLDPAHEKALLAMAQLQLEAGQTASAIDFLEKAYRADGAAWRTHYLLASAYAQAGRLPEAEAHASVAANYVGRDTAPAIMLLAQIQYREGKKLEARQTWQKVPERYPGSPTAAEAKNRLAETAGESNEAVASAIGSLPLRLPPETVAAAREEVAWAPPDIDSKEYPTAKAVSCRTEEVLDLTRLRLNSQLLNFEKFTATERIVHQEIGRDGVPGPAKEKDFTYIVFVIPYGGNSLFLDESRDGGIDYTAFPSSVVTTGINSLAVALLQPANRDGFLFQCEGLTDLRGQAAWQIRFEQRKDTDKRIRRWRTQAGDFNVRIKGRLWVASATYDVLQIETDLLEPVRELDLKRDHLLVKYGSVSFMDGKRQLWLPWGADMYMEFRHRRYHHQHFLTSYMLFDVDTKDKVNNPSALRPEPAGPG